MKKKNIYPNRSQELMSLFEQAAKRIVTMAKDAGINYVNVSQGSYENPGAAFAPDGEDDFTRWAPGFKEASSGLPIVTPNFRKLPLSEGSTVRPS